MLLCGPGAISRVYSGDLTLVAGHACGFELFVFLLTPQPVINLPFDVDLGFTVPFL